MAVVSGENGLVLTQSPTMNLDGYNYLVTEQYLEVLEKTNHQLSLWFNPYGIMVGILTLLVAIATIAISIIFWRNSREQREQANKFFLDQEKILRERNESIVQTEKKLDELIGEYRIKLSSTTKDQEKKINGIIEDLKKEKATLGSYIGPAPAFSPFSLSGSGGGGGWDTFSQRSITCTSCGRNFRHLGNSGSAVSYSFVSPETVYCSFCGARNLS